MKMKMMMKMICLILVSISVCWWNAVALPASTVQVRLGEDVILPCLLLDTSTTDTSTTGTSTTDAPTSASNIGASPTDTSTTNAAPTDASTGASTGTSTISASLTAASSDTSPSNTSTTNASSTDTFSTLSWYRKAAGRRPELLLTFRYTNPSHVTYGAGVGPDKVLVSADGSLLLYDSKRSDSAVYYCSITQGEEQRKEVTGK